MAGVAIAISRALPIDTSGDGDARPVLLPLFDLVNHNLERPTTVVSASAAKKGGPFGGADAPACATLIAAATSVEEGGALTVRYGGASAGELLLDYGFLSEPVAAVAPLAFALDDDDRFIDEKTDALEVGGMPPEGTWLLAEEGEAPPAELLAFLRLKHLGAADCFLLEPVFIDALWKEHLQNPISEENERDALEAVEKCCEAALSGFGGSLREDLQTLAEADSTSREYALASVRYAERRALQATSRAVETRLGSVKNLEFYQQRRLNSLGLQPVESEEEIESLRVAGRQYSSSEYDW